MHDLNIVNLAIAVEDKYGEDEEPKDVFLQSLSIIKDVCSNIRYGSFAPEAVNSMGVLLADLAIACIRMSTDRPYGNRISYPRQDSIVIRLSDMDWAFLPLSYGRMFYATERSAARSFTRDLMNMVHDTATMYGLTFDKILEIAEKRALS